MRILLMTPNLDIGGVQSFVCNLAVELSRCPDNEVYLLCFTSDFSEKYSFIKNEKVNVIFLNKKPGFSIGFLIKLYRNICIINPDIINTHSSRTFRYLLVLPINRRYKIVHTITNNPRIYNPKVYCLYRHRIHQRSWEITLVGISDIVSDTYADVYHYDRKRIRTIYNGIKLIGGSVQEKEDATFFICAGLTAIKRHELLLSAFALIDERSKLIIAGDGPRRFELEKMISELGIQDRTILLGNVMNPNEYYKKSRYFVLTSKSEGNPLCVIEALSAGCLVVAPHVGGIPDLITNGENGFTFDVDATPESVAMLMSKCLNLPEEEYIKMSNENKTKVCKWDIREIAAQYLRLFEKVVNKSL